ncbi:glycoside hydrolase family 43 protein [Xylariomycetidae sp. FL2044]|nr:glycoside hydrolase family 43 protein [Xylariomycetidae sp. FL2044]
MKTLSFSLAVGSAVNFAQCFPTDAVLSKALDSRDDFNYVFSTFTAEDENTDDETTHMDIYVSIDGTNFAPYAMDTYKPKTGYVRDPSIMKLKDTYYICYTAGLARLGVIRSHDLKDWEPVAMVDTDTKEQQYENAWAPEFIQDSDGAVHMIASLQKVRPEQINPNDPVTPEPFHAYILHAQSDDLTKWSSAQELNVDDNDEGSEQGHIDMFPFHVPGDSDYPYHAFQKNEEELHIEQLRSKSIHGPWEYMDGFTNDWAGWGEQEGPAVTRLRNGDWIIWMDNMHGTFSYATTSDINDPDKFTDAKPMPGHSDTFRHGTVIKIK